MFCSCCSAPDRSGLPGLLPCQADAANFQAVDILLVGPGVENLLHSAAYLSLVPVFQGANEQADQTIADLEAFLGAFPNAPVDRAAYAHAHVNEGAQRIAAARNTLSFLENVCMGAITPH